MAEEFDTVTIPELDNLTIALTSYFATSNLNGKLGKATVSNFVTFIAPYIKGIGASGFIPVTGTVLPASPANYFALVGAGTYTQTTGGDVVTTAILNIIVTNGTTWSLVKGIDTAGFISRSEYNYGGKFSTLAAANLAITNTVVNGTNQRDGKRVDIGTAGNYVPYWWNGGFADANLVKISLAPSDFVQALQDEVNRLPYTISNRGTTLTTANGGNDGVGAALFRFNRITGQALQDGVIDTVTIYCEVAGDIAFAIVESVAGKTILKKQLASFTAVVGSNTFTLNEPILAAQFLSFGGISSAFKIRYGFGITGETFVQGSSTAEASGGTSSFYCYSYILKATVVKPLDPFIQIGDSFKNALQKEVDTKVVLSKNFGPVAVGSSNDTVGGASTIKTNSTSSKSDIDGTLKTIKIQIATAGTLAIAIGSFNDTTQLFTFRKRLPLVSVIIGENTLTINEPIYAGEFFGVGGTDGGTAVMKFGYGASGNKFAQYRDAAAPTLGPDGTYYAFYGVVEYNQARPLDTFLRKTELATSLVPYAKKTDLTSTPLVLRAKRNGTVGVDCEFTGNNAIQDAIDSITDATDTKRYVVQVIGVFEALAVADFKAGGITNDGTQTNMVAFVRGKDFVSLKGVSKAESVINGFLPNNLGTGTSFKYQYFQTVYWNYNGGTFENLTITGKNLRYPLHIDGGRTGCKDYKNKLKNVRVEHLGNTANAVAVWGSIHPIGLGMSDGQIIEYEGISTRTDLWPLYIHTNESFVNPSANKYRDCRFGHTGGLFKAGVFQSLGSHREDELTLNNCVFEGGYVFDANDNPYIPTALSEQHYNHCNLRVYGAGNSPLLWIPNFNGKALRFTSKSTGATSTVRFDTTSTAFPVLIKDKDYGGGTFNSENGEVNANGYAYSDGDTGLKGYAIGRLDIGGEVYGLNLNTYGKSLGKRLGDCSTVNKTLTVIVDGTTYNIVFNKNYIGTGTASTAPSTYTNAQILAEITAVVGSVCDVTEYVVGNDYYPELSDVMIRSKASEVILKGMAVYSDNGVMRKALSTDTKVYGIALDNFKTGNYGRVLIKGYLSTVETDRFSTLQDTYVAIVKGDKLGVSTTPGKLSKSATTKLYTAINDGVLGIL